MTLGNYNYARPLTKESLEALINENIEMIGYVGKAMARKSPESLDLLHMMKVARANAQVLRKHPDFIKNCESK